jgi:tetratricopeptide (TPR) repeat protein
LLPIALRTGDWSQVSELLSTASASDSLPNLAFFKSVLFAFAQGMQNVSDKQLEQAEIASTNLDAALWRYTQNEKDEEAAKKKEQSSPAKPENHGMPPDPVAEPLLKNMAILSLELRASILAAGGNITESEKLFANAREQESDLGYHEPPAFIRPVAEQEAIVLMAAGKQAEARVAWQHSLDDRPKSGFALYGLAEIAEQSGDTEQTTAAYREFLSEWKSADANLPQVIHAQEWMRQHTAPVMGTR